MPRTIWSGAISFGLVTVPINVVSATEDHSIHFHQYHLPDQGRVRYRRVCELEDREVSQDEIGKGYELTKTQVIPITDEDLSNLPLPTAKAIEIDAFVPLESVDPIRIAEATTSSPPARSPPNRTNCWSKPCLGRQRWRSRSTPGPAESALAYCGSARTSWSCTPCAGRTRSATPPSCCRHRPRCRRERSKARWL